MRTKNSLMILGLILALMTGIPSINAFAATVTWDGGGDGVSWNDGTNWDTDAVPTSIDDVIIPSSYTVSVNTAVDIRSLTVSGTLEPDASTSRTIKIRRDLVLNNGGQINYTDVSGSSTGRLSWTFEGESGTNEISNLQSGTDAAVAASLQFYDVTINGTIELDDASADNGNCTIYGDLTVNGSLTPEATTNGSTVYFDKSSTDASTTIQNNGTLNLDDVYVSATGNATTNTDMDIAGDITVASGGTLSFTSPSIVTKSGAGTVTNNGTLTFASGTSLNINANTTFAQSIADFDGDITVAASALFKVNATYDIQGAGSITTSSSSTVSVNDGNGIAGAIDLSSYSFDSATDIELLGGITGFTDASVSAIRNLYIGNGTSSASVVTSESFSMSGDLLVRSSTGSNALTASAGTITMTGSSKSLSTGGESVSLYGLAVTGTVDAGWGQSLTFTDHLSTGASGTFAVNPGANTTVWFTGSDMDIYQGAANSIFVIGDGSGGNHPAVNVTGVLTMNSDLQLGTGSAAGGSTYTLTVQNGGELNFGANTLDVSPNGTFSTASGALLTTAAPTGLTANFGVGTAVSASITIDAGTDLKYESGALALGLASVSFSDGGTQSDLILIDDLTIDGGQIVGNMIDGSSTLTITGNLTLESGKFAPTGDVLAMSGSSKQIVNNGNSASLSINSLYVSGAITTTADFKLTGASATVMNVESGASFVASASSSISMTGATSGTIAGPGTLTFYDLGIYNGSGVGTDVDGTASFTIANDFTVGNSSAFVGYGNSKVTISGSNSDLVISGTASSATFAALTVSGDLSTSNSFAAGAQNNAVVISGSLSQSASTFHKYGTGQVNSSGNSSTFFVIDLAEANSHTFLGDIGVVKQIGGSGTFIGNGGDDLTFYGDQEDADALTDDERNEAWVDVATEFGNVIIPSDTELQLSNAYTSATMNSGTITVNGRLESSATINLGAANSDGAIIFNSGSELYTKGTVGGVGGLFWGANITTGSAAKQFDDNVDYFIGGSSATLGFADITGATGDGVTSTSLTLVNNVTTASTGAIILGESFTFTGDLDNDGGADYGSATSGTVTVWGSSSEIASSNSGGNIDFWALNIGSNATNSTASATIGIRSTGAGGMTVENGGAFESSASFTIHDDDGGTANNIYNANSTASDLTFNDLFLAPAATNVNYDSDFVINGSATISNLATMEGGSNSTLEFTGTSKTITVFASDAFINNNLTINGLIYTDTGLDNPVVIKDDFNVTSTGQFVMGNGSLSFTGSTTQTLVNEGTLQLHDVHVAQTAGNFVYTDDSFSLSGGLHVAASSGSFIADGTSLITLTGTSTSITNMNADDHGKLQLQNLTVNASAANYYDDIMLKGNLIVNSGGSLTFNGSAGSSYQVIMDSTSTKSISNDGTLVFDDLIIADATNNIVTTDDSFTISGSFSVGGGTNDGESFTATAGAITLGTSSTISNNTGSAEDLTFYSLTIPTGASAFLESSDEVYVDGDLTVNGTGVFTGGTSSKLWFTGSSEQNLTLGATAVYRPYDVTLNNSSGLKLNAVSGNIGVSQFDVQNILRLQSGDIDLNGDNIITIDYDANPSTAKLDETTGNTILNNGVSTATGHVYATAASYGSSLVNKDFAGLGMVFTMDDPGNFIVKRYHIARSIGGDDQVARYYSVTAANSSLDAKIVFKYDESEISTIDENDLLLMYSDDETNGPWVKETTATVNTSLNRLTTDADAISAFTGATEWWTIGAPNIITAATTTKGLAGNPLGAGTDDNAIFGVTFSANGEIELGTVRFNLGRNLGATNEATSFTLYYSEDDDFDTDADNTSLITGYSGSPASITGGATGDSYVQFDVSGVSDDYTIVDQGQNVNYFLAINTNADLTTATATITPQMTQNQITVSGGIVEPFTITGDNYSFQPSIEVEPNENGLDESPLVAGEDGYAIFGFKAEVTSITGLPGFEGFTLGFDNDPSAVFDNVRFYVSTDSDFRTTGDNTEVTLTTETIGTSSIVFGFNEIKLNATPKYFFVVADVRSTVNASFDEITPTLTYADIVSTSAGVRGTDGDGNEVASHTGYTYEFVKGTVTITTDNNISASDLGIGSADQPVFGFTVTPDNSQQVTLTEVILDVDLSTAADTSSVSNWKLVVDANDNGYLDASETTVAGTYVGSNAKDNVTFTGFSHAFSSARNYIVVARVKSTATNGTTLGVNIPDERYLTITSPNTINAGGPFPSTNIEHTFRTVGTATTLEIVQMRDSSVASGSTLPITVRSVDASGYPANVSSAETVTLAKTGGTGTVGGTVTGTIASGKYYITIEPTFTATSGSTDLTVNATGSSLAASGNSSSITILEADPSANDGYVVISNINTTSARISEINAASTPGDGRVVVIRQGRHPEPPTDGVIYSTSLDLGSADDDYQTGPGSYVVYDGVADGATTLDLSGLMPGTRYYVAVFEYNGTGSKRNYASASAFTSDTQQNPVSFTTTAGDFGTITTAATAANIQTDINVSSKISSASDVDYFKFTMPSGRSNAVIRISNLPANYNIEIYDASAGVGTMTLLRDSEISGSSDEVIVINNLSSGPYIIKVYGATEDDYDSSNSYTIRVSTSSSEIFTQGQ